MPTQSSKPPRVVNQKTLDALAQGRAARIEAMRERGPEVHLWRGAPATRAWSRYQDTVEAWSVCGISLPEHATQDADQTTCPFCLQLLSNPRRPA